MTEDEIQQLREKLQRTEGVLQTCRADYESESVKAAGLSIANGVLRDQQERLRRTLKALVNKLDQVHNDYEAELNAAKAVLAESTNEPIP